MDNEHTVYEVEGIGLVMGFHLLHGLGRQLTQLTSVCSDSQALIKALNSQHSHPGQHILDLTHNGAERLHAKQDGIINKEERLAAVEAGYIWKGHTKNILNLQVHWVPGHVNFAPNEQADEEAKLATQRNSSNPALLPGRLVKLTAVRVMAVKCIFNSKVLLQLK